MDKHEHEQAQSVDTSTAPGAGEEFTQEEKEDIYARALCRTRMKMALYIHAVTYAGVMTLLVVINLLTSPRQLWVVWPLFGWGAGLFLHWLCADRLSRLYENTKAEEIAKELEKRRTGRAGA